MDIYHDLARERPSVCNLNLANSLDTLSNRLAKLIHHQEALTRARESLHHYRHLAREQPAVYTLDVANSLNTLSLRLATLGFHEEALQRAR